MRYKDWDILLFPAGRGSTTPFKEFRVDCQVIPDVEFAYCQGAVRMPIMTGFVPSIPSGAPFRVSVHSWSNPEVSQYTRSYSKHVEDVQFEARIFIDGQMVASDIIPRKVKGQEQWPHQISSTFDMTESGEPELLKFPSFRKEPFFQGQWTAGDPTSRIKVVICEGFPRDSLTAPIERVKNIVAFSFQHAPLDVLETKGIAWPNPSMWRVPAFVHSMSAPGTLTNEGVQSHAHSPRRNHVLQKPEMFQTYQCFGGPSMMGNSQDHPNAFLSNMGFPSGLPVPPRNPNDGLTVETASNMPYFDWLNSPFGPFANDFTGKPMWPTGLTGMASGSNSMMQTDFRAQDGDCLGGEPMHISGPSLEDDPMPTTNLHTKVPTNTPTAASTFASDNSTASATFQSNANSFMAPDFAHSLTHSLLNQPLPFQPQSIPLPASEIKSRKERDSRFMTIHGTPGSAFSTPQGQHDVRKFSQPLFNAAPSMFDGTASPSPLSAAFTSAAASRNASVGDTGSNLATVSNQGTPLPLRNSSATSLNVGVGSSRKRGRNYAPASAKAIDEEDQPLRPSPHLRTTLGMMDDDSDQ